MLYEPQVFFNNTPLVWSDPHAVHVAMDHTEVINGDVRADALTHGDSLREADGVGGGVEEGSSAAAVWPAALAAKT